MSPAGGWFALGNAQDRRDAAKDAARDVWGCQGFSGLQGCPGLE